MAKNYVAQTPQYEISVDKAKNRIYLKITGFWRSPEVVPEYINDWKRAVSMAESGFTLLTDAKEMKIHPGAIRELHGKAQTLIINRGVKKVAELQADKISEMQLDGVSRDTKLPKKNFTSQEEAEKWLDE